MGKYPLNHRDFKIRFQIVVIVSRRLWLGSRHENCPHTEFVATKSVNPRQTGFTDLCGARTAIASSILRMIILTSSHDDLLAMRLARSGLLSKSSRTGLAWLRCPSDVSNCGRCVLRWRQWSMELSKISDMHDIVKTGGSIFIRTRSSDGQSKTDAFLRCRAPVIFNRIGTTMLSQASYVLNVRSEIEHLAP